MTKWAELWLSTVKAIPVSFFFTYLVVLNIFKVCSLTTLAVDERERQNCSQCCLRGELLTGPAATPTAKPSRKKLGSLKRP